MEGGGGKEGEDPFGDKGCHHRVFIRDGFIEGIVPPAELLKIPFPNKGSHVLAAKSCGAQGGSGEDGPSGHKEFLHLVDPRSGHSDTPKVYCYIDKTVHFEYNPLGELRQATGNRLPLRIPVIYLR
jgi:hypothetical protein